MSFPGRKPKAEAHLQVLLEEGPRSWSETTIAAIASALLGDLECSRAEARLLKDAPKLRSTPKAIRELRELIADGADPLGVAFVAARPAMERRSQGATFTPDSIVAPMVDWAADVLNPRRIVDPGTGSGRFLIKSGQIFKKAELVGVESDPLAALIARANLRALGFHRRSFIHLADYRSLNLPSIDGETLFIGNPPYVRHHQIPPRWKEWLTASAALIGLNVSQLAGMHVHFFLATALMVKHGDGGVFVTSAEWLDVNYGQVVRDLLLDGLGGVSIHVLDPTTTPFEGTATTGAITCFRVGANASSLRLRQVKTLDDLPGLQKGKAISKERLREARRWSPFVRSVPKIPEGYIELGEVCRVHRGSVTGLNRIWITGADDPRLPQEVLVPSVTRARELFDAGESLISNFHLKRVIDIPPDLDLFEKVDRKLVEAFLQHAEEEGAAAGYIAQNRRTWWSVGLRDPAPILATYMARRPPTFVRNLAQARHINIAHGLYPREPLSDDILDKLARELRASVEQAQGRTYAGGLTKFEPREMERLPVPTPELLSMR